MNGVPDTRIPNVRIPRVLVSNEAFGGVVDGDCLQGTLVVRDGRAAGMLAEGATGPQRMVLPKLTDAHCHLDKCHTINRLGDVGGDLLQAIDAQGRDKENWTAQDLAQRASKGLEEFATAGCGAMRSHVDWGDSVEPPLAWHVFPDLPQHGMTLQWAALTGIDRMADSAFARAVAQHISQTTGGVLGSFVLHHGDDAIRRGLKNCFAEADRLGLALDFHVDESLDDFNGVEAIADAALETGFDGPILCGHAVALMRKAPDEVARIADKLARAGITICALPTTNLYLQSRTSGTPDRRGITRLRELAKAGVPVIVGSDNVADAFCPLGQHDPMAALHLACLAGHLDPPLARHLPMTTTHARRAMGLDPLFVDDTNLSELLITDAADTATLIAGRKPLMPLANHIAAQKT